MTGTLTNGYSSERTQQELSNDRVQMFFKNLCILVIWTKVSLSIGRVDGYVASEMYLVAFSLAIDLQLRFNGGNWSLDKTLLQVYYIL